MATPAEFDEVKPTEAPPVPDFRLQGEGTISILYPLTERAEQWATDHLEEGPRWGTGYVIEHRYVGDILFGIHNDGLEVRK
jgi:hypothetical protein